jgi:transposase
MATIEVFMSNKQYTAEFKAEAIKQVTERGFSVADVAARLGLAKPTLYDWVRRARKAAKATADGATAPASESAEVRRLKAELRRVTEERDILKKAAAYFAKG